MGDKKAARIISLENLDILDEIREVFYQNTGLIVSFHYPTGNVYDFYPVFEKNRYCRLIQSTKVGLDKCVESDTQALIEAKRRRDYCTYVCHAGLTNVVIPLEYKGVEIGAIYTGQILTERPSEELFDRVFSDIEHLGIRKELLKNAFLSTKVVDEEKLLFGTRLLSLMSHYIVSVEDEMYLQREVFEKDRDILRHEYENMKLQNELQNLRIAVLEFDKGQESSRNSKNNHIVDKAQKFIKANYHKNIRLSDVARAVYLSPNYFSTIFKQHAGYTFSNYLMKIRMQIAKKLLVKSDMPIKKIVHEVGFDDYNYFNRQFRKIEGVPPARFRKNHAGMV